MARPREQPIHHPEPDGRWRDIAATPEFRRLLRAKARFIIPASVFFIIYYFALPALVGYFPDVMERRVIGAINLAYLFALSQFIMAWAIMWLYVRQARRWDAMEHEIISRVTATAEKPWHRDGKEGRSG